MEWLFESTWRYLWPTPSPRAVREMDGSDSGKDAKRLKQSHGPPARRQSSPSDLKHVGETDPMPSSSSRASPKASANTSFRNISNKASNKSGMTLQDVVSDDSIRSPPLRVDKFLAQTQDDQPAFKARLRSQKDFPKSVVPINTGRQGPRGAADFRHRQHKKEAFTRNIDLTGEFRGKRQGEERLRPQVSKMSNTSDDEGDIDKFRPSKAQNFSLGTGASRTTQSHMLAEPSCYIAQLSVSQTRREKIQAAKGPSGSSPVVKESRFFAKKSASQALIDLRDDDDDTNSIHVVSETAVASNRILCIYPPGKIDSVTITEGDLRKLHDKDTYINDSLLDFYLKHIQSKLDDNMTDRVHIFTSYLYSRLEHCVKIGPPKELLAGLDSSHMEAHCWMFAYSQVWRWTTGFDLLERDYILFPINQNLHWSLIAVCFAPWQNKDIPRKGRILSMDSLGSKNGHDPNKIAKYIRRYLDHVFLFLKCETLEARNAKTVDANSGGIQNDVSDDDDDFVPQIVQGAVKNEDPFEKWYESLVPEYFTDTNLPLEIMDVRLQTDGVNCGIHLLNNAEMLVEVLNHVYSADSDSGRSVEDFVQDMNYYYQQDTFNTLDANKKREEIYKLVMREAETQHEAKRRKQKSAVQPTSGSSVDREQVDGTQRVNPESETSDAAVEADNNQHTLTKELSSANDERIESMLVDGVVENTASTLRPNESGDEAGKMLEQGGEDMLLGNVLPMPTEGTYSQSVEEDGEAASKMEVEHTGILKDEQPSDTSNDMPGESCTSLPLMDDTACSGQTSRAEAQTNTETVKGALARSEQREDDEREKPHNLAEGYS